MRRPSLKMMFEADGDVETDISQKPGEFVSVDRQILRHIMDAERVAVKLGRGQQAMSAMESLKRKSMRFLLEAEESGEGDEAEDGQDMPPLDVGTFATEIMRVVKNYDTLLDIPSVIVNRTVEYLASKYDEKTADSFKQILRDEFDYEASPDTGNRTEEEDAEVHSHLAVGAIASGGAGGV
jgi:hypothetical protein